MNDSNNKKTNGASSQRPTTANIDSYGSDYFAFRPLKKRKEKERKKSQLQSTLHFCNDKHYTFIRTKCWRVLSY